VHFNTVVDVIEYSNDKDSTTSSAGVKVISKDGRIFTGTHVLIATPVSIIQQNEMEFIPPLSPEKQLQFANVPMSPALKVWFEFETRLYPDIVIFGDVWTTWRDESNQYSFLDAVANKPTKRNILLLFNTGSSANANVKLTNEVLVQNLLHQLDDMFDGQASANYIQSRVQNWVREPYIQGGYSEAGNYNKTALLQSVDNKLYFAGEYLATGGPYCQATVHGAAISGRTVAQQMLEDYAADALIVS
jgi:monoamine oxidase